MPLFDCRSSPILYFSRKAKRLHANENYLPLHSKTFIRVTDCIRFRYSREPPGTSPATRSPNLLLRIFHIHTGGAQNFKLPKRANLFSINIKLEKKRHLSYFVFIFIIFHVV